MKTGNNGKSRATSPYILPTKKSKELTNGVQVDYINENREEKKMITLK
jgi:hypothetical protein